MRERGLLRARATNHIGFREAPRRFKSASETLKSQIRPLSAVLAFDEQLLRSRLRLRLRTFGVARLGL